MQHLQRLSRGCIGVARVPADTHRVMLLVTDGLSQETARLPADFGVLCRDAVFGHLNFHYKALWPDMLIWLCTCSRPCSRHHTTDVDTALDSIQTLGDSLPLWPSSELEVIKGAY